MEVAGRCPGRRVSSSGRFGKGFCRYLSEIAGHKGLKGWKVCRIIIVYKFDFTKTFLSVKFKEEKPSNSSTAAAATTTATNTASSSATMHKVPRSGLALRQDGKRNHFPHIACHNALLFMRRLISGGEGLPSVRPWRVTHYRSSLLPDRLYAGLHGWLGLQHTIPNALRVRTIVCGF